MNQSAKTHANPNRSAAAQFFLEDDNHEDYSSSGGIGVSSSSSSGNRAPAVPYYGSSQRNSTSRLSLSSSSHSSSPAGGGSLSSLRSGISSSMNRSSSGGGANHHHHDQHMVDDEDKVPELLMKAAVTPNDDVKLENLQRVKDIIVIKQPALLDNFLDEILNFQLDGNPVVRRFILEFIVQACEADPEIIPKILDNMVIMLSDPKVSVQKKAIQVSAGLYKLTLMWLCRAKNVTEEMENTWNCVNDLKKTILRLIDSDNDAIRTHTVKFIETVILLQTPTEEDGLKRPNEFCLDDVPITLKVARPRKLEEDARNLFEELLKFHGSRHATSVNLMTVMGSIVIIAKIRPTFMAKVVTAIEKLNAILPPTLERSQVTSVRKYMKAQLITLLRHSRGPDYYDGITTLLTDLGATFHELSKAISNWDSMRHERKKRHRTRKEAIIEPKRIRLEPEIPVALEEEDSDDDEEEEEADANQKDSQDQTQEDVASHLNEMEKMVLENLLEPEVVADLVIASMKSLPDTLPSHFTGSFTPVAIAGTETQVRHVSRLLATQITAHQLGPQAALQMGTKTAYEDDLEAMAARAPIPIIASSGSVPSALKKDALGMNKILMTAGVTLQGKKKSTKPVKLSEITKPFSREDRDRQMFSAVKRILNSRDEWTETKCELISSIVTTSAYPLRAYVMEYIKGNIKMGLNLGLHWLFGEYSLRQGFLSKALPVANESSRERYDWAFFNLMRGILDNAAEGDKASLAWRLFMEPPIIPDNALDLLKVLCGNILQCDKAMLLLTELTLNRPKKLHYLSALLEFCSHASEEIRGNGVKNILKLYSCGEGVVPIEDKAVHTYLSSLRHSTPPEILFTEELGRPVLMKEWNEELVKACLHLYFQLLTVNNELIHSLGPVFVETSPDIKRLFLRLVEPPIRKMGMHSPSFLKLLDTFPKGAETLMTKIIHIVTDKTLPTAELVSRVRHLYTKRIADVRFLIPVLNGLSKAEILSALPKLMKLNPIVVKEVFNRLLGVHSDAGSQHDSPISPVDLMVALHNIETSDVKTVIKATSLCFNEADVYTAEVLAMVINQLLDQNPLPMLLMRTIIQAIALHPQLTGFIMSALSRMIGKKVWTQPKVWEGFIKCCQRTIPKSVPILLQLPPTQLNEVLQEAPDIREPLINHLMAFSQQQRASMDQTLMDVIFGRVRNEIMMKQEYYDNYSGGRIKPEPGSPGSDELSIAIKNEPMEIRHNE